VGGTDSDAVAPREFLDGWEHVTNPKRAASYCSAKVASDQDIGVAGWRGVIDSWRARCSRPAGRGGGRSGMRPATMGPARWSASASQVA
jgi:hypothetical protein